MHSLTNDQILHIIHNNAAYYLRNKPNILCTITMHVPWIITKYSMYNVYMHFLYNEPNILCIIIIYTPWMIIMCIMHVNYTYSLNDYQIIIWFCAVNLPSLLHFVQLKLFLLTTSNFSTLCLKISEFAQMQPRTFAV